MISTITLTTLLITWVAELPRPNWQRDYASAYKTATEQKKPLAIFLGHGADGFKTLVKDGVLSQDDAKKLNDEFVPFYIDTDSKEGQELAKSFEMSEGLVISDHTGLRQAVRYEGQVSKPELTEMLSTYSQPNRAVVTTENRGRFRGAIRSVITAPVQFMGGNGTCRTGNCPNR